CSRLRHGNSDGAPAPFAGRPVPPQRSSESSLSISAMSRSVGARLRHELDERVHITVRPSRALEPRAEQGKLSDPVLSADALERLGVDRQATVHRHLPTLLLRDLLSAPWESNPAPTDYEPAALTRHEL